MIALLVHGKTTKVPRLSLLLAWIGEFLPKPERIVDKYYAELRAKHSLTKQESGVRIEDGEKGG